MSSRKIQIVAVAALVVGVASAAWGAFDSPSGQSPFGKIAGVKGDKYEGVMALLFRDFTNVDLTAGGFEAVARLSTGKEFHVFRAVYECSVADPCGICDDAALPNRIDVTQIVPIQVCLQDQIAADVLAAFGLPPSTVQLQAIDRFASEIDPNDASVRSVVADIQVAIQPL